MIVGTPGHVPESRLRDNEGQAARLDQDVGEIQPDRRSVRVTLLRGEPVRANRKSTHRPDGFQLAVPPNAEHADAVRRRVQHEEKASVLGEGEIRGRAARTRVRRPPVRIQQRQSTAAVYVVP